LPIAGNGTHRAPSETQDPGGAPYRVMSLTRRVHADRSIDPLSRHVAASAAAVVPPVVMKVLNPGRGIAVPILVRSACN
jgi:hypothetical protein